MCAVSMAAILFQFTPLREGRRDTDVQIREGKISIHAPPRGATGSECFRAQVDDFNSRPSARGDGCAECSGQ